MGVHHVERRQRGMLIDGAEREAISAATIAIEDPSERGSVAGEVPDGGPADVGLAVEAAQIAFRGWRRTGAAERARVLSAVADKIEASSEDLSRLLALETGSAIRTQARPEIALAVDLFRYFAGLTTQLKGETTPLGEEVLSYTRREPLGVVAAIVPWNAPVSLAAHKIAPALAAGNTMVLKPSAEAPLAVLAMAALANELLPPGVLNVVTGRGDTAGAALASHPVVRKISFTGGTETGKAVLRIAADRIVPTNLELGGKSPCIVLPDVDDDRTVDGVIAAMRFGRQGQACTAGSRLFLHADIFESFTARLVARLSAMRVGDPQDEASDIGALCTRDQFRRVVGFVEEGLASGATARVGGLPPQTGELAGGYYALPTVLTGVQPDWRVAREEVFGPVLVVIPWTDENEVIRLANDTHYGLAGYVFTGDLRRGITIANELEAGWIQINQAGKVQPGHAFGGYKQSGLGREGSFESMLDNYTQRKNITANLAI